MFRVLYIDLRHHTRSRELTKIHYNLFGTLQKSNPCLKSISKISKSQKKTSLTVDFLIKSCGLSPERALSAAKKVSLFSTGKPDSVISLFQNHGLTKTQIAKLIYKRPSILLSDSEKTLKPKIKFLHDLGVSDSDIAKLISSDPTILTRSLKNQMIPSLKFIKSYIGTESDILTSLKRSSWILQYNLQKVMGPNIAILKDYNVPRINISKLLISQPRTLMSNTDRFKKIVEKVQEMGFSSTSPMFFHAVRTLAGVSKLNWEKKSAIYQEFGWSETDILLMFRKQPFCMLLSDEKIRKGLTFYIEKLKWSPADMTVRSSLLLLSLEKRVIPRCAVLQILNSKGIATSKMKVSTMLKLADRIFLERFVTAHQESVPEVMNAYKGEIEFVGFEKLSRLRA